MVTTCDQAAQNAQWITRHVFNLGASSLLEKALMENDLLDVTDWTMLTVANLELLTYTDNGAKKHLSLGQWNKIRQFQMYILSEHAKGSPAVHLCPMMVET
jgi:Golgi nucleoside diphosphatase